MSSRHLQSDYNPLNELIIKIPAGSEILDKNFILKNSATECDVIISKENRNLMIQC